jgi:hypothetical protein
MEKNSSPINETYENREIRIDIKRFGHTMTLSINQYDLLVSK